MASDDPTCDIGRDLGRSVAQLHLKLARLHETVESQANQARQSAAAREGSASRRAAGGGETDALLDLLDAVDAALARRTAEPTGLRRLLGAGRKSSEDLWLGVAVAAEEARERLRRTGIESVPEEGPFDPLVHHAIEIVPVRPGGTEGTLAATHRRGWLQRKGDGVTVLRTAQVGVHGEQQ